MHTSKLIVMAGSGEAACLADRWPPVWGLFGAFVISALMWWTLLSGVRVIVGAFMS